LSSTDTLGRVFAVDNRDSLLRVTGSSYKMGAQVLASETETYDSADKDTGNPIATKVVANGKSFDSTNRYDSCGELLESDDQGALLFSQEFNLGCNGAPP